MSLPTPAPANRIPEPVAIISPRVLAIIYDPIVTPAGEKLSKIARWESYSNLSAQFIADILECSGGLGRYQIVDRLEINQFPAKMDGFTYTAQTFADVMRRTTPPHNPDTVNYPDFLTRYNIIQRVALRQIDEVWVFGFPYAGFYESTMGGPGAFICNSYPLANTSRSNRRFIIMGFSLERGVGEMLEAMGHRAEAIMDKVYTPLPAAQNLWQKFIRHDKTSPGQANCGNIHFAPNSDKDYDWGNPRTVTSYCDDWKNFPAFKGTLKPVTCAEWGNGDIREHHKWWFKHLPHTGGRTNGISNNWWQYILDPNRVTV